MTSRALCQARKFEEAHDLLADTFNKCVRQLGPNARITQWAMHNMWELFSVVFGRADEAEKFKQAAIKYGCDVSCLDSGGPARLV